MNDKAILFVHIPKCGGSSFERQMNQRGWREYFSVRGISADKLSYLKCSPQHLHAELLLTLVNPVEFDDIVTLVREPLARLRSEYTWQLFQGITTMKPKDWIEHVFDSYAANNFMYDNHIRPQCEFLIKGSRLFKLEEQGVDKAVSLVAGTKVLGRKNLLRQLLFKSNKIAKATSKSEAVIHAFESKKNQIYEFYEKDYEALGYTKSS
ncbi:MAG: sulfotransferase family 2 domain-containing protein [Flavobacteriaceae bacterium]|nr:sulfotransferase family 2 domain-containing protein [Flavobacteriaceae bacterium]